MQYSLVTYLKKKQPTLIEKHMFMHMHVQERKQGQLYFYPDGKEVNAEKLAKSLELKIEATLAVPTLLSDKAVASAAVWFSRTNQRRPYEEETALPPYDHKDFRRELAELLQNEPATSWHEWDERMINIAVDIAGCTHVTHSGALSADPRFFSYGAGWDRKYERAFGARMRNKNHGDDVDYRFEHRMSFVAPPPEAQLHEMAAQRIRTALLINSRDQGRPTPVGALALLRTEDANKLESELRTRTEEGCVVDILARVPMDYGPLVYNACTSVNKPGRKQRAREPRRPAFTFPRTLLLVQNKKARDIWPVDMYWLRTATRKMAWAEASGEKLKHDSRAREREDLIPRQQISSLLTSFLRPEGPIWRSSMKLGNLTKWQVNELKCYDPRLSAAGLLPSYVLRMIREGPVNPRSRVKVEDALRKIIIEGTIKRWRLFSSEFNI